MITSVRAVVLWISGAAVFAVLGLAFLMLSTVAPTLAMFPWAGRGCRLALACAGLRLRLQGSFPSTDAGPYLYLFNHTSMLDSIIIPAVLPEAAGAVGKKEQFAIPIWGPILRRWGVVPLDRFHRDAALASMGEAEAVLAGGRSLLMAPEGTRSSDGELGTLKKGAFHLAINTGATIVPIIIRGAWRAKNRHSWVLRPGNIDIQVAPPISPTTDGPWTVESLREETRRRLAGLRSPS